MRRIVFLILGLLEIAIAAVLVLLGSELPGNDDISHGFEGAQRVTDRAGTQVQIFRRQVQDLRHPQLQQLAVRMQSQTQLLTRTLRRQQVDFETVRNMRDALGEVASGLDSLAEAFDPKSIRRLGDGLGEAAAFLEDKVVPGANLAADHIETSTAALRKDAERLAGLLRQAPLDLKAAREIHQSLGRFGEGLERMNGLLKAERLDPVRDGFRGIEEALTSGADQVERLASFTYPVVEFNGLKPEVTQKQFWPEGEKIAAGMRKAATGATAAGKEMDGLTKELPQLRAALDESRKVVVKTREALGLALAQQDKVEPLLKDAPAHAAKLAEDLPKVGQDLANVLRDTKQMKEVAGALRQARQGIDATVSRWPELRKALTNSAALLRATRDQLDGAIENRDDYETAMKQTIVLADSFAAMLPMVTEQFDNRLDEEEHALGELGQSLDEVKNVLPAYERTTKHMFQSGRILAWLAAAVIGLHGCYLALSFRLGRRYSF
jgi:hypothetical protein